MQLTPPVIITARLLPGIPVGGGFISIKYSKNPGREGRTRYHWFIDLPDGSEHEGEDLQSGCQGGTLQEGMACLLGFLSAAGDNYRYVVMHRKREITKDDNASMFPLAVTEWAYQYSDELSMLEFELADGPDIIAE